MSIYCSDLKQFSQNNKIESMGGNSFVTTIDCELNAIERREREGEKNVVMILAKAEIE